MDVKNMWVSEIRKVLTGQLEACRGMYTHTHTFSSENNSVRLCYLIFHRITLQSQQVKDEVSSLLG